MPDKKNKDITTDQKTAPNACISGDTPPFCVALALREGIIAFQGREPSQEQLNKAWAKLGPSTRAELVKVFRDMGVPFARKVEARR